MKKIVLPLLTVFLISCGASSNGKNINGFWDAQLRNSDGSLAYAFPALLAQAAGSQVTVSNFSLGSPSTCFPGATGQTATFTETGNANGIQTGPFTLSITTLFPAQNNVLALAGNRNSDGGISGDWTLTGLSGCSGSGSFSMALLPPV